MSDYEIERLRRELESQRDQRYQDQNMTSYMRWVNAIDEQDRNAEECMAKFGKYPTGYSREKSEHDREQAYKTYLAPIEVPSSGIGGCLTMIAAAGLGIHVISNSWDTITNAVKTAGEFVLMAGVAAAGTAVAGGVTVGAYKASNFIWEKITGDSSPIKSALTTAALFATVAGGGTYFGNRPAMGVAVDGLTNTAYTAFGLTKGDLKSEAMQKCRNAGGACAALVTTTAGKIGCVIHVPLADGRVAWNNVSENSARAIEDFRKNYGEAALSADVVCSWKSQEAGIREAVRAPFAAPAAP